MDPYQVVLLLASLILGVFFNGIEVAFLTSKKVQLELLAKHGDIRSKIILFFIEKPTWFIGTTLLGSIICVIYFSLTITLWIVPITVQAIGWSGSISVITFFLAILLSFIIVFTFEFFGKAFFILKSNDLLRTLSWPFVFFAIILFPIVFFCVSVIKLLTSSFLKLEYSFERPVFGLTNVNEYLQSIHRMKVNEENIELDKKILSNALEFKSVRVRDCMIPRTEIVAVSVEASIKQLQEAFIESGHSKILVYRESIDDVVGYCHSSALFKKPENIDEILTPIITVPETTLANELMIKLINERKSLAVVVDEFGGTSGLISMEDVIEEIFGEIEDEHDEDDLIEQKLSENTFRLSARIEIDYLNDKYGWNLPTGDYETIGGLILEHASNIPKPGEVIALPPFIFEIEATEETRINTLKVIIRPVQTTEKQ